MGSLFGGTKSTSKSEPWKPQGDQLKYAFDQAQNTYKDQTGKGWYGGDLYAGADQMTKDGTAATGQYVQGQGNQLANALATGAQYFSGQGSNWGNMVNTFNQAVQKDPTKGNIDAASQYANNPYMDAQIDASNRDVRRMLTENTLPSIDRAATGSGNLNSSRAGVAAGIAARGAQDQMADTSAMMRGNAYQNGLSLAEQARQFNMGGMAQGAGMYGDMVGQGLNQANAANSMQLGNLDSMIKAGQINQQDAQGYLDASYKQWEGNDNREWDLLNKYYGIIGSNNWGGTNTAKSSSSPGILGAAMGIGSMAASFSDPRLKRNIQKLTELDDGLGVYSYQYNWSDEPEVGVMADEVEKLRPWALGPEILGYKTVNYEAL